MRRSASVNSGKFYIPLIYIIAGVTWILLSDRALPFLEQHVDVKTSAWLNSAKGVGYVIFTGLLLSLLIAKSERNLLKSEKQYRNIYHSNPYPVWFFDPGTYKFMSVNDAAISNYGYSRKEFLNMTIFDLHGPEDVPALKRQFSGIAVDVYKFGKWRQWKKSGEVVYVNINSLLTTMDDRPAIMVLVMDITEKIADERNLEKSKFHLENTLSSISDSYFTVNRDLVITKANANFYERTGISEEVVGKPLTSIFPDAKDSIIFQAGIKAMNEDLATKVEAYYEGLQKWLHVAYFPTEEGIAVYFTDITERKEKEAEIIKQNEQLKRVAWLNSHEIRKPVASLLALADLFNVNTDQSDTAQIIQGIQKCTRDLDRMIHEINKEASNTET